MKALPQASAGHIFHSGIIAGKLKGVIPATTPSGWRIEYMSMPGPAPSVNSPFSRCGAPMQNSATSRPRITSPLASGRVLPCSRRERLGELVHVAVEQLDELHHHPRAALRVGGGPARLRRLRALHRGGELGGGGERHARLHLAGRRVEDVGEAAGRARHALAVDEVAEVLHAFPPSLGFRADPSRRSADGAALNVAGADLQICMRMADVLQGGHAKRHDEVGRPAGVPRRGAAGPAAERRARTLGLDPATVGRRIAALEEALGARLFDRSPQGYALTEAGRGLLAHAQAMESQASAAAEEVGGQPDRLSGTVRIGAPDGVSNYLLVDACDALSPRQPRPAGAGGGAAADVLAVASARPTWRSPSRRRPPGG